MFKFFLWFVGCRYPNGGTWTSDECTRCRCENGSTTCKKECTLTCTPPQALINHDDECCYCANGKMSLVCVIPYIFHKSVSNSCYHHDSCQRNYNEIINLWQYNNAFFTATYFICHRKFYYFHCNSTNWVNLFWMLRWRKVSKRSCGIETILLKIYIKESFCVKTFIHTFLFLRALKVHLSFVALFFL